MSRKRAPKPEPESPRDILAAEAFAVGEADRSLHHEPVHDVLAAEEFAVPAPEHHSVPPGFPPTDNRRSRGNPARWVLGAVAVLGWVRLRRRRRRAA